MRKGAAAGPGPAPERRRASDPRIPGATLVPAPPRRVGLQALWPGDGAGAAAAGFGVGDRGGWVRSGFWSGARSGNAGSEPPLMVFFGAFGCEYFVLVRSLSPPRHVVVVVVVVFFFSLVMPLALNPNRGCRFRPPSLRCRLAAVLLLGIAGCRGWELCGGA
ncbi:hypothetical protein BS78_10G208200 [Paspalum vaginatum]|nr:hypothetical protein BS78_10G208200 [Paspalum vaginatum]